MQHSCDAGKSVIEAVGIPGEPFAQAAWGLGGARCGGVQDGGSQTTFDDPAVVLIAGVTSLRGFDARLADNHRGIRRQCNRLDAQGEEINFETRANAAENCGCLIHATACHANVVVRARHDLGEANRLKRALMCCQKSESTCDGKGG